MKLITFGVTIALSRQLYLVRNKWLFVCHRHGRIFGHYVTNSCSNSCHGNCNRFGTGACNPCTRTSAARMLALQAIATSALQVSLRLPRIASHLFLNCDFCIGDHICIFHHMKRLARLAVIAVLATTGLGLAHASIATPTRAQAGSYSAHGHGGGGCKACRIVRHPVSHR
jgi:hypothetical protein